MNYVDIVNLVFNIVTGVMGLFYLHFLIFAIAGLFKAKKWPHTDTQLKYGLIIPARNEEKVVGNLIKSIQSNKYPQDKLHIFVIAHNCTDKTAEIARSLGATVYEYNNENEKTMGYAFRYLFTQIEKDYGTQNYDGFFLFNADNVLAPNYFEKMNDAFVANDKKAVITSFRNSKNFGSNPISGCYGLYFLYGCMFEMKGRTLTNVSTRVSGTGYVINSEIVKEGWKYVTLTEDWEFTADQIIAGNVVKYCNEAEFFDEQPTSFKIMWRQRVRWSKGHLLVCITRLKDLLKSLFAGKKRKNSIPTTYDYTMNVLPFGVILAFVGILRFILLCFCPLFGIDFWGMLWDFSYTMLMSFLSFYGSMWLTTIILWIYEHKRIHDVSFGKMILYSLIYPAFIAIQVPIDIVALFKRNVGWKVIPHKDETSIDNIEERRSK